MSQINQLDRFSQLNLIVTMAFFMINIGILCYVSNPILVGVSLVLGMTYYLCLKSVSVVYQQIKFLLPMLVVATLMNPLFSHEGITVLWYFPTGSPLTLESLLYGAYIGFKLLAVVIWFGCFNHVMTTDKLVYLFGKITPSWSLLLSMSLRLLPRLLEQFKQIEQTQKMLGYGIHSGPWLIRIKNVLRIVSILMTWSFENAIETANSMKQKGYGVTKRTQFSILRFRLEDRMILIVLLILTGIVGVMVFQGAGGFQFYPRLSMERIRNWDVLGLAGYAILSGFPLLINLQEQWRWRKYAIVSK